eukprot:15168836-Heterocapsa_arctica.AAC.1
MGGYSSDRAYADRMVAAMKKFHADGACGSCASPDGIARTTADGACGSCASPDGIARTTADE